MRSLFFILIFFIAQPVFAQTGNYYYTPASKFFFTNEELDAVFYKTAAAIFHENDVPENLFEKKYPKLKRVLIGLSQTGILQSFRAVESTENSGVKLLKGSADYIAVKDRYTECLVENIRKTFGNKVLQLYFSFDGSDRIILFKSIVRPSANGKLAVQEIITVYNGDGQSTNAYGVDDDYEVGQAGGHNDEIKRGIVRAFPLTYVNEQQLFQNTTFDIKEVLKNGVSEQYHTEKRNKGMLLFTGNKDVFLPKGTYTYRITYETDHQLKMLKDYDELYWNVTGNGWSFRIDSATCTVVLPKSFMPLSSQCYTGALGESKKECAISQVIAGDSVYITFTTTRSLLPFTGITIATSWPKGLVQQTSFFSNAWYFFWNNKAVFFLPLAALFSFVFCLISWMKYGIDKKRGSIYPLFEPPPGFPPAALGYIYRQKFNRQLTAATLVDAAVRNVIKIDVKREGWLMKNNQYNFLEAEKPMIASASEYEVFESDVQRLVGTAIKKGKYSSALNKLNTAVQDYCEKNYKNKDGIVKNAKGFFASNRSFTEIPNLFIFVATVWGFAGGVIPALNAQNYWQVEMYALGFLVCVIVVQVFKKLLPSYTTEGRRLMDQLEGFRMFLSTADVQRFDSMAPPEKTLELYEKHLPFAIALGCDVEWGEQFKNIIDSACIEPSATAHTAYSRNFSLNNHHFTSAFTSSFSGAIWSASTPPSGSSGGGGSSFGGGSSGGGGGGGGGGGW